MWNLSVYKRRAFLCLTYLELLNLGLGLAAAAETELKLKLKILQAARKQHRQAQVSTRIYENEGLDCWGELFRFLLLPRCVFLVLVNPHPFILPCKINHFFNRPPFLSLSLSVGNVSFWLLFFEPFPLSSVLSYLRPHILAWLVLWRIAILAIMALDVAFFFTNLLHFEPKKNYQKKKQKNKFFSVPYHPRIASNPATAMIFYSDMLCVVDNSKPIQRFNSTSSIKIKTKQSTKTQ